MKARSKIGRAAGLAAALAIGGCGGDSSPPRVTLEVPDSAGASSAAFISYIQTLDPADESSEPLIIKDSFALPPDDDAEPIPLT